MDAKNFYAGYADLRKNTTKSGAFRALLLVSLLWLGGSASAQTVTYSQSFSAGALASPTACNAWTTFRASLLPIYSYTGFTVSGSLNPTGLTCNDPATASAIAAALRTGSLVNVPFGGHIYQVGGCSTTNCGGDNIEFAADPEVSGVAGSTCECSTSGFTIRPNYGVAGWWGGIGSSCGGIAQTLTLTFNYSTIGFAGGASQHFSSVCSASSIDSVLTITDANTSTNITWSQVTAPIHGTLSGLPQTTTSLSNTYNTLGATYTPTASYSGLDSFTIQATDGTNTATTKIIVTVPAPPAGITGNSPVCPSSIFALGDTTTGGTWSSSNTAIGTVSTSGVVTALTPGNTLISYTVGTCSATANVTVNTLPSPITGTTAVCAAGGTTTLSDATTPGTWTSSNTNATIGSSSGVVTGVNPGNSTITYTASSTGCTTATTVTVNPLPVISGGSGATICNGSSATLTASGGISYSWMPNTGLSTTTGASVVASPATTTTYTVTGSGLATSGTPITISYNQNFVGGATSSSSTPTGIAWGNFMASLSNLNVYSGFTVSGTFNTTGYTCTDPVVAQGIANALNTQTSYSGTSDGHTWNVVSGTSCGSGYTVEFYVDGGACSCAGLASIRPWINNANWGGVNAVACPPATQNMQLNFYGTAPCTNSATVTVTVNQLPTISTTVGSATAVCQGSSTTLTATGAATYTWAASTDLSASTGTSVVADPTSNETYTITGTDTNGCVNTGTIAVAVNPLPDPISGSLNFCMATSVALSDATGGGTWSSSNTSVATVDPSGNVSGVTAGVDTIIYTLSTTCSAMVSGTVNPLSDVAPISNQSVCNGVATTLVTFTGSVPGTTFNWTSNNGSIGIATSGTDSISSFAAIDTSISAPDTANITIVPSNNGCPGTNSGFSFYVNPTPDVFATNPPQTLCNGVMTNAATFAGDVPGTIFDWSNSNSSIGLAANGTGDIAPFAGIDTSALPVTANITVTPSTPAGCTGGANSFTITVDPKPLLNSLPLTSMICDNTLFNYMPSSLTPDSSFTWSRSAVPGISNPDATGSNNTNEVLSDTTTAPVDVTYVYALTGIGGCVDTESVIVTVNPQPTLTTTTTPPAVCDSTLFTYGPGSATSGVTFAWSRDAVVGISNPAASGSDTINEYLVNYTTDPINVTYVDTLSIAGCSYTQNVTVAVNPSPVLSPLPAVTRLCDSSLFTYVLMSNTTGTTYAWSRAAIAGNPAASGGDTINEVLTNNTTSVANVIYMDTLTANGCVNVEAVTVPVLPQLLLSSPVTPAGICDSAIFNYPVASATAGATFSWVRPFVLGIGSAAGSGTGNPNEQLINNTNDNLNVTYNYTINDSGCSNTESVVVVVHPVPTLSSPLTATVCSGTPFYYALTGYVFGTTFNWTRAMVAGIGSATDSGAGTTISETLTDSLAVPVTTNYGITLTANGCMHQQSIAVTVNPTPVAGVITTRPSGSSLCSNTLFQNFGAATLPAAGQTYTWSMQNAEMYGEGVGHQYILVDFKNPGTAVVTLTTHQAGVSCIATSAASYDVTSNVSDLPQVVYFNGQLVCLQNNMDSYQWGYDDALTLDSTLIPGEVNPNYFISSLDLAYRYYWVMTTRDGCSQKTYYNVPSGITNINPGVEGSVKVYPNPASEMLNVAINTDATGKFEVEVQNILGQKLMNTEVTGHSTAFNVASLPAGTYMVVCSHEGVKMAAVRFVKN